MMLQRLEHKCKQAVSHWGDALWFLLQGEHSRRKTEAKSECNEYFPHERCTISPTHNPSAINQKVNFYDLARPIHGSPPQRPALVSLTSNLCSRSLMFYISA